MVKTNGNGAWFMRVRSSYLPTSTMGLVLYFVYLGYLVALMADWIRDGHHVWYLLVDVIPLSVGAALVTQYIASKHTK